MNYEDEQIKMLADNLWKYFEPKTKEISKDKIAYFRATVTAPASGGKITIRKPFDNTTMVVRCAGSATNLRVGDQCVVMQMGCASNCIVVSDGTMSTFGSGGGGGGGGTSDHTQLTNRDAANQHPISAINGLQSALDAKGTYSKPSGGIPKTDLASAVQTSLGRADTAVQPEAGKGLFSGSYNDLTNKPTIPAEVTESTVSGWGFTKNTGTYSKPTGGIPKTDLASAVQTSLGRADTAVQPESGKGLFSGSYNDLTDKPTIPSAVTESTVAGWGFTKNTGTYSKPTGGIPKTDLASAVQTSLGRADTALQSFTETDPVFSASPAAGITSNNISTWNGKEPSITAGTTSQYLRGDKTWQTLNKSAVGLGNVDNVKQYSASNPPPYPVTSVNGQTGAVTVQTGGDVVTVTITSGAPDKTFSELYAAAMDGKVVQAIDDETNFRYQLVSAWPEELDFGRTVCGGEDLISSVQGFSMFDDETVWFSDEKSLIFMNELRQAMNRLDDVTAPDTNYSTLMARGEKLLDATTFDGVTNWGNQLVNGAIAWKYE